jgi:hypothetical protein
MERGGTELMHAAAKCYTDFRKEHPDLDDQWAREAEGLDTNI